MRAGGKAAMNDAADLYLDLLKRCLTRELFIEEEVRRVRIRDWRAPLWRPVERALQRRGMYVVRRGADRAKRAEGLDWPPAAETMIGLRRLDNLQRCAETVIREAVPGDLAETGVWRGGASIFMRAVLAAHGVGDRTIWVADSFRGLPPPNPALYPADRGLDLHKYAELSVDIAEVKANFSRYGLLDERVRFLEGWFKDTLPRAPIERLAVLRLDGDLYESTMDALGALYPRLSVGGFVIVDDYDIPACARAVEDYRRTHGIVDPIEKIENTEIGVFWRRR
jgi:O-methyltransferase